MTGRPGSPESADVREPVRERLRPLTRTRYDESWPAVAAWLDRVEYQRRAGARALPGRDPWGHARRPHVRLHDVWGLPTAVTSWALVAATVLVLAVACVLPIPREETLGQMLRVRGDGAANTRARLAELHAGLPWMRRGMLFTAGTPGDRAPTLLFVAPRASAAEAARWARDLEARTGTGTVTTEPLHDVVRRPAYAVAVRTVLSAWGAAPAIGDADLDARIRARLSALGAGGLAVKTDGSGDSAGSLVAVPRPAAAAGGGAPTLGVYVPGTRHVVLWMLRRRPDGAGADTVRLALDSAAFAAASGEARQVLVERALRARGVTNVRVEFVNGGVWVRTEPGRP